MLVLLYATDLMTISQASGAAAASGGKVASVASATALEEKLKGDPIATVIFDIDHARGELTTLVAKVRADCPATRIVAFGPHVREEMFAAAHAAGCDIVLTRGQFIGGMGVLFQKLIQPKS